MLVAAWMMIAAQASAAVEAPPPVAPPLLVRILPVPPPPPAPPPQWAAKAPHKSAQMVNLGDVFTESNYPFWAYKYADEGNVRYRVSVNAAGRAVACEIVEAAEAETLNQPTCDLVMAQARFTPATDRRGRPIASVYARRVRWQLENREPWPVTDEYTRVVISLDAAGTRQCRTETSPGKEIDPRSCDAVRASPPVDGLIAAAHTEPDAAKRRAWQLVLEESQFGGDGAAQRAGEVGSRPGEQLNDRTIIRVTLNPAGVATGCEIVEGGNAREADMRLSCERTQMVVFEASSGSGDRRVTLVSAVYLRPR